MRSFYWLIGIVLVSSCYVVKAYKFRKFNLKDLSKLDAVILPASEKPFQFVYDTLDHQSLRQYLDTNLTSTNSYAFLVIRNDSILYERYFGEVTASSVLPSFSAAKSITSTLLAIALNEGYIKSLKEPVTNYLPQLIENDKNFKNVTIQHVLDMRSGVESNESYTNPFSNVLKLGFAKNVSKQALKTKLETTPGVFNYKSVNTQLLALIIEKATGRKLQDYAIEKLWKPLSMEYPATWNDDKKQTVRAFCCINAAARDYAKFGRLFLNKGNWQGKQIVPEEWIASTTQVDTMRKYGGYKNQWWSATIRKYFADSSAAKSFHPVEGAISEVKITSGDSSRRNVNTVRYYTGAYHAEGLLGQFVYVNPTKKIIIVRLGHDWSHPRLYAREFIYKLGEEL